MRERLSTDDKDTLIERTELFGTALRNADHEFQGIKQCLGPYNTDFAQVILGLTEKTIHDLDDKMLALYISTCTANPDLNTYTNTKKIGQFVACGDFLAYLVGHRTVPSTHEGKVATMMEDYAKTLNVIDDIQRMWERVPDLQKEKNRREELYILFDSILDEVRMALNSANNCIVKSRPIANEAQDFINRNSALTDSNNISNLTDHDLEEIFKEVDLSVTRQNDYNTIASILANQIVILTPFNDTVTDQSTRTCELPLDKKAVYDKAFSGVLQEINDIREEIDHLKSPLQCFSKMQTVIKTERDVRRKIKAILGDLNLPIDSKIDERLIDSLHGELRDKYRSSPDDDYHNRSSFQVIFNRYRVLSIVLRECRRYEEDHETASKKTKIVDDHVSNVEIHNLTLAEKKLAKSKAIRGPITPEMLAQHGSERAFTMVCHEIGKCDTKTILDTHEDFRGKMLLRILLTILTLPTIIIPLALWKKPKSGQMLAKLENKIAKLDCASSRSKVKDIHISR